MKKALCIVAVLALAWPVAIKGDRQRAPAQAERGRELFLNSSKGTVCETCHALAGVGTAVGPDLTKMASMGTPHNLVMMIRMTMTNEVQLVKTADGKFPGFLKQKQGDETEIWDLSQTPPVLRKLASKEIVSMERDTKWQHPPASIDYTSQKLADIIGFLKWAAAGSKKEIKPADVGDLH
jgi:hypothetical protein